MTATAPVRAVSALAALDTAFERIDGLLEREIQRLRARYELSLDEFRGLYISDEQVNELVASRRVGRQAPATEVAGLSGEECTDAGIPAVSESPLRHLGSVLDLDQDALDIVLLALAPDYDSKYEVLFAYLNNDVTRKLPTAELAARVFGTSRAHRVALRGLLAPDAPLLARGVVEQAAGGRDLPRSQRGFGLAPPLADWLLGLPWSDERLAGVAELRFPRRDGATRLLAPDTANAVERVARWINEDPRAPAFVCTAPSPGEGALAATAIFAAAARPALVLDLAALRIAAAPGEVIAGAELMQRVLGVGLVAGPLDALFDAEQRPFEAAAAPLRRLCARSAAIVLVAGSTARWGELLRDVRVFELRAKELASSERAGIWRVVLGFDAQHDAVDALADRFVLGADRIARAAQTARDAANFAGRAGPETCDLYDAARAVSTDASIGVTRCIETALGWEDLVVPPDVRSRLTEVVRAVELRPRVLGQWGFGARVGTARGIKVLFAGASGTGKTMAAAIIAKTLGLDLHKIELAATVSKYLGETEKNLDNAFNAARRANAILFIDEAEALLGKRSEVKDAHDRYANVEIAYLLQRMEDHDGVVILATNLAQNIDDAFSRRMQFVIDFPLPDPGGREAIWRGMIPATAPVSDDVDFAFLARRFSLSGGDIRNIALDAAYRAADEREAIGMRHMLRAVAQQFAKRGKVPSAGEFREYAALLTPCDASGDGSPSRAQDTSAVAIPGARAQAEPS